MNQPIPLRADPSLLAAAERRSFTRAATALALAAARCAPASCLR